MANADESKKLRFLPVDYCPLICLGNEAEGIMVDILKAVFTPLGYDVSVIILPTKRAQEINMMIKIETFY